MYLTPDHGSVQPLATPDSLRQPPLKALAAWLIGRARSAPTALTTAVRSQASRLDMIAALDPSASPAIQGKVIGDVESRLSLDTDAVARLMSTYCTMQSEQRHAPEAYQPGADWGAALSLGWHAPSRAAHEGDVSGFRLFLDGFFRNEALTGFWGGPDMYILFAHVDGIGSLRRASLMQRQLETWQRLSPETPVSELAAPLIGKPWGYLIDGHLVYEPACEYHYHARYLQSLFHREERPVVIEVGGGFGGLAYQFMKTGRSATYVGVDLPENSVLQAYYLQCAFPEANILLATEKDAHLLTRDALQSFDAVLLPNYLMPRLEARSADILTNIRSLSEMPEGTITEYVHEMSRLTRRYLFHENLAAPRADSLHGLPVDRYPEFEGLDLLMRTESRWPRYGHDTAYPCDEFLYERRDSDSS